MRSEMASPNSNHFRDGTQRILATCTASADSGGPGERAINRYEGEPEGLSIRLAFVGRFLLLADDDAP